jgi:HAD superfamily hydrolase (TIGR01450 family)
MAWILDLDGVLWLGDTPIPGSFDAVHKLRARGERVLFLTNNSSQTIGSYADKMEKLGLTVAPDELCTSAQAAAELVEPGEIAFVCGGEGIVEALTVRGVRCVRELEDGITAVVAGFHKEFDFTRLNQAFQAIHAGARLIGTNDDPTYPTPDGPIPGGGAIVAAIAYAAGVTPVFGGKPNQAAAAVVFRRLGLPLDPSPEQRASLIMVGDRPSTDGGMARTLGGRFGLVLSGVTSRTQLPVQPTPDLVFADLQCMVDAEFPDRQTNSPQRQDRSTGPS